MRTTIEHIIQTLAPVYGKQEALSLARWIVEETTDLSWAEALCCDSTKTIPNLHDILTRLLHHEPVQYIFGHSLWMGMDLRVTPAVLIPRPETAELVEHVSRAIAASHCKHGRLIDIGTGSGCIAIALKQLHPTWDVTAVDVSNDALKVAADNASRLHTDIDFLQHDILSHAPIGNFDIVVSNPPYIRQCERNTTSANTGFEPPSALYVPDSDPMLFFRRIAERNIAPQLWFEINEYLPNQTADTIRQYQYQTTLYYDQYGKPRILHAYQ